MQRSTGISHRSAEIHRVTEDIIERPLCSTMTSMPMIRNYKNNMRLEATQANRRKMEQCVSVIKDWCSSRRLQLNADMMEVIWFGFRANIKKLAQMDMKIHLGLIIVEPVTSVRNIGVYMDGELNISEESLLPVSIIYVVFINFETSCSQLQCSVSYLHLFSLDWITTTQS